MAATMASRVAQLQGLAHTDAQPCSPPSLLYESPSNHKVATDSTKDEATDQSMEDSSWRTNHTEDSASKDSIATAIAGPPPQGSLSTTNHTAVPESPLQARRLFDDRIVRSNSTGKVAIRRRAACPTSAYSAAEKNQRLACPASDAGSREATSRQRFLNIFEDENSAEAGFPGANGGSVQRLHPRSLMHDAAEAKAIAADADATPASTDRYLSRGSSFRCGSYDSSTVQIRHYRSEHRSSEINRESSSESSTDAVSVKPSRSVKRSLGYSSSSEVPMCGARKSHVKSDEERHEQQRLISPRYDQLFLYGKKGRHMHHGEACFPHLLSTHNKPSMPASTLPTGGTANPSTAVASPPTASTSVSAAVAPAATRGAVCAPAESSLGAVSSRYCGDSLSEDADDCETEELLGWKGWRELLLERQRAMEKYMHAQRRHINRRDKEQLRASNKERGGRQHGRRGRGAHTQGSNLHNSTESDTQDEATSKEDDPLGISPQLTATKRSRSSEKKPTAATATPRTPASPQQQYAATSPPAGNSFATARGNTPPLPAGPPFFGTSFPTPPFYPSWPPPFYAAAVAAAAAARRAGEEAGMTGQERIQDLKKALELAKKETKDNQEEARSRLEEEKKKHKEEREELKNQLAQLRETLEEREKEVTVAAAKHAEAEKQKKVLREEFDIITRVHKDMKEEFQREKDTLLAEKASLQAKVEDLEKNIEFSKDQLLVARESLVAARAKQLTATQAHEQDLKTLQEYRLEIETLREDLKYLQILNLSLSEKVQRFSASPQRQQHLHAQAVAEAAAGGRRRSELIVALGRTADFPQQQRDFHQCAKHGSGNSGSNITTQRLLPQGMPTLQELLSPQLQQKLLRDRQNECRGGAACAPPLKEATFTLPSSLESHSEPPAAGSPPAAVCNGTAVGLPGDRGGGQGLNTFAQAAVCAAGTPAAAAEGKAVDAAAGGRAAAGERRAVEHYEQEEASRLSHHRLSFPVEERGEPHAADAACILDSARARLRTASPVSQSCRREADAATGSPVPRFVAVAPRCRSLPLPVSVTSAASAAPLRERGTQISRFTNSLESEEEMRLARLCATVLGAHAERDQNRVPQAAGETHTPPAVIASSSFRRASSSLFPASPCPRAALLQPRSGDAAATAEQRERQQQQHYHQQQQLYLKERNSRFPPAACTADADSSFEATAFPCEKRDDYGGRPHSFDKGPSAAEDQPPASNASGATEERRRESNPTHQEWRLLSDASYVCTEKHAVQCSYAENAEHSLPHGEEKRIVSGPLYVNVVEPYVPSYSCKQSEKKPFEFNSCVNGEKISTSHSPAKSSFAQGGGHHTTFLSSKKPLLSCVAYRSGQQRFSHGSYATTDSHLLSAFEEREENAAAPAAVESSAAADRVGARCSSHYTEENSSSTACHLQIPGNSKTGYVSNVGRNSEMENWKESKTIGSTSKACNKRDERDKEAAGGGGGNCRKKENAQRSDRNAEEDVLYNVGIHRKAEYVRGSNREERICNSSGVFSSKSEENMRNGGKVLVPGLALDGVPPSISCKADMERTAGSNSSLCSGPNSARTQWLLNRVARISRLQGLHNIHEKLKDLPPALLAASDSTRRSCQDREAHKVASNNNNRDNSSSNSSKNAGQQQQKHR